jgi:hypothetical protein
MAVRPTRWLGTFLALMLGLALASAGDTPAGRVIADVVPLNLRVHPKEHIFSQMQTRPGKTYDPRRRAPTHRHEMVCPWWRLRLDGDRSGWQSHGLHQRGGTQQHRAGSTVRRRTTHLDRQTLADDRHSQRLAVEPSVQRSGRPDHRKQTQRRRPRVGDGQSHRGSSASPKGRSSR